MQPAPNTRSILVTTVLPPPDATAARTTARIIALRHAGDDAYGKPRREVLLAARFERHRFDGVQWDRASALDIVDDAS